jgi:hypothetical protein
MEFFERAAKSEKLAPEIRAYADQVVLMDVLQHFNSIPAGLEKSLLERWKDAPADSAPALIIREYLLSKRN